MKFEVIPVLSMMEEIYQKPPSMDRFQLYISELQGGTKGDLSLPIGGYNPMGKAHVNQKLAELKALDAEGVMSDELEKINSKVEHLEASSVKVVLNLADDHKGGWTNRYTTDFDSKFKLNALVKRNFCTPYFWTSENYNDSIIRSRTQEYVYRTVYWMVHQRPVTLEDHVNQEIFVSKEVANHSNINKDVSSIENFYSKNKEQDDYSILFNFFYGDEASASLGYPTYDIAQGNGYEYARVLSLRELAS